MRYVTGTIDGLRGIALRMPRSMADDASRAGDCSAAAERLARRVNRQLTRIGSATMVTILAETGGWDRDELAEMSETAIRSRIAWLAACDWKESIGGNYRR